jgi:Putative transposase/Transposase zinc-binding domain
MARPTLEVADVFRRYGDTYRQQHAASLSTAQRRVMTAIETCRTAVLGGHLEECDACGHQRHAYNSCANRHCPKCQSLARAAWIERRTAEVLDCEYFHVVFTVPAEIAGIALQNKAQVYGILFRATAETLRTIAADPQHLGAEIGFFAVLHSWGQTLGHHPHLHCVVPGGGLSPDGTRWVACRPGFFLPVRVLSRLFRRLFLQDLQAAYDAGTLHLGGPLDALRDRPAWMRALAAVRQTEWVVYAKRPFAGPQQVVDYVGRYTHRVAISNDRLLEIERDHVRFTYKDYRADPSQTPKTMTLAVGEFIRRFLLHVLPTGFHRIRYYGFLGARHRRDKLARCRQLLGSPAPVSTPADRTPADATSTTDYRDRAEALTGVSLRVCPVCHHGQMIVIERLRPTRAVLIVDTS